MKLLAGPCPGVTAVLVEHVSDTVLSAATQAPTAAVQYSSPAVPQISPEAGAG